MKLVIAVVAAVSMLLLSGCATAPAAPPMLAAETGQVLAPYLARVDGELASAERAATLPAMAERVGMARSYLAPVLATVGPASPTSECPEQAVKALAKVEKKSLAAVDREAREKQAQERWARVRSQFWYLLLAGAAATAACLAFALTRALAVYPAAVAVGSGGVLIFASSLRQIVADLAATAWGLIPVVLIGAALAGTAAFVWSRLRRTKKVLHAVEDGVEALDAGAKAAVKHAATDAGVERDLNASLVERGLSEGQ